MVTDRAFIFHLCISCGKTFSLGPKLRSFVKVKVKYQGHIKKKHLTFSITLELSYFYMCFP